MLVKTYICIVESKAIHLEPASNLTTDAFIAAHRHFTA